MCCSAQVEKAEPLGTDAQHAPAEGARSAGRCALAERRRAADEGRAAPLPQPVPLVLVLLMFAVVLVALAIGQAIGMLLLLLA